jgi:hypothetical protein
MLVFSSFFGISIRIFLFILLPVHSICEGKKKESFFFLQWTNFCSTMDIRNIKDQGIFESPSCVPSQIKISILVDHLNNWFQQIIFNVIDWWCFLVLNRWTFTSVTIYFGVSSRSSIYLLSSYFKVPNCLVFSYVCYLLNDDLISVAWFLTLHTRLLSISQKSWW